MCACAASLLAFEQPSAGSLIEQCCAPCLLHCRTCGQHLGWRFTATRPGLMPRSFWGIRRPGLLCATAPAGSSDGSEQEEPQGRLGPGGGQRQAAAGPQVQEQNWMDLLLRGVRRGRLVLHLRQQPEEADDAGG